MPQSAVTVTPGNPTPPTNLSFVGSRPPLDPLQAYADDGVPNAAVGTIASLNEPTVPARNVFAAKTAAAGSGTSVDHEGKGNETLFTQTYGGNIYAPIVLTMDGCGPALVQGTMPIPNQIHASTQSPVTNPALVSISPTTTTSGTGTIAVTATGTNFVPGCQIRVNNVPQTTTFVSATSLTANVPKSGTATTWPVVVTLGGLPMGVATTLAFT